MERKDLKEQERNTLFFIGNGFDLFHELKTSYNDFHDWLMKYRYDDFVSVMEKLFPTLKNGKLLLWKDFEKALGLFNPFQIHANFFQGINDGMYNENVQKRVVKRIKPYLDSIPELLREWVSSISLDNIEQKLSLSDKSLYMSFNYTPLLEKVYYIPQNHILHIHNSVTNNESLITGHLETYPPNSIDNVNVNIENSVLNIVKELNGLRKPVEDLIVKNQNFFNSLKDINQVVVFGHSLSEIDRLYFTEVVRQVHDDTTWIFAVKDDEAKKYYKHFVDQYIECLERTVGRCMYKNRIKVEFCKYISVK